MSRRYRIARAVKLILQLVVLGILLVWTWNKLDSAFEAILAGDPRNPTRDPSILVMSHAMGAFAAVVFCGGTILGIELLWRLFTPPRE